MCYFQPLFTPSLGHNFLVSKTVVKVCPSLNMGDNLSCIYKTASFYICIMTLRIKTEEAETKESELKASQHGKEMYVALSYCAPFCAPHTFQHLAFDEQFAAAFVCFYTKCWVMQRTSETCK